MPDAGNDFQNVLKSLSDHYDRLLELHGYQAEGAQWRDRMTQELRMRVLCEVGDLRRCRVLDFGCGSGHLLDFLRSRYAFEGEYVGWDISPTAVRLARARFPGVRFEQIDVLADSNTYSFDYVLASGVFNNAGPRNWELMTALLSRLYPMAREALAFNALSTYVDYRDGELWYVEPEKVFAHCKKNLSQLVTLRHDYRIQPQILPYEFTVYVRHG